MFLLAGRNGSSARTDVSLAASNDVTTRAWHLLHPLFLHRLVLIRGPSQRMQMSSHLRSDDEKLYKRLHAHRNCDRSGNHWAAGWGVLRDRN